MQRGLRSPARPGSRATARSRALPRERGYLLLTLIFMIAIIAITATALLPSFIQETKRDREDEMRHRGTQYMRAIKAYNKKLGRYPAKIEDLESTNNQRFLRRRYKDPITGEDFKLLHYGDSGVKLGAGFGGPVQPGPNGAPANAPAANLPNRVQGLLQQNLSTNPTQADPNATDTSQAPDAKTPAEDANGNPTNGNPKTDAKTDANADGDTANADQPVAASTGPTLGGGAIVGVVSTSKKESIREFNHKHRYNQWLFYYDPQSDRGGLLNGPTQPPTLGFGMQGPPPGQNGNPLNTPGNPNGQTPTPEANPGPGQGPAPIGDPPQN